MNALLNKLSLKKKLILMIVFPFFGFLLVSFSFIIQNYS